MIPQLSHLLLLSRSEKKEYANTLVYSAVMVEKYFSIHYSAVCSLLILSEVPFHPEIKEGVKPFCSSLPDKIVSSFLLTHILTKVKIHLSAVLPYPQFLSQKHIDLIWFVLDRPILVVTHLVVNFWRLNDCFLCPLIIWKNSKRQYIYLCTPWFLKDDS